MTSYWIYKLCINVKGNYYTMKKNCFALKQFVNCKVTLLLAKLDMVGSRLVSNGVIFSDAIPVDIPWATFLLLSNISELKIGEKNKKFL